jgi:hypothetical protein
MFQDFRAPEIHSSERGYRKKRVRIGIYDEGILCIDCEKLFQPWDDYAKQFLLSEPAAEKHVSDELGKKLALFIKNIDYPKLKLFFLSVLWRASVSTHEFFRHVRLGPHEPTIGNMIKSNAPGDENDYSTFLYRFEEPIARRILISPYRHKFDGVNYYRLYAMGYQMTPEDLQLFTLKPEGTCWLLLTDFKSSKEYEGLKRIKDSEMSS